MAMPSLKEFLAERAETLRSEQKAAALNRDEWIESVGRLLGQMRDWLKSSDPDGFLHVNSEEFVTNEEGLGEFRLPRLVIQLGTRDVRVEPIARYVAGPHSATGAIHIQRAYGRVDMTDGLRKFMIFRVDKEPQDRWIIIEQNGYRVRDCDQSAFE